MAADHVQFLKNRFMDDLKEAETEFDNLPLGALLHEISEVLADTTIKDSTALAMKDWLYDLKYVLAECVMLEEEEQKRKTQNKNNLLDTHCIKKLWFLSKTEKKLTRIRKKLQDRKDFPSEESYFMSEQIIAYKKPASPFFDRSKIHGFDEQMQKIEGDLLVSHGDGVKTVGIVGMTGSGKTTIAQMLFNSQGINETYTPMIWVQLSKDRKTSFFSKEGIARGIIHCLTDDFTGDNLFEMLQQMYMYLHDAKYLIVLDNVIDRCDWYYDLGSRVEGSNDYSLLSHGLPRGSGGAIIVTSRDEDLAGNMVGEQNLHRVQPILDTEICWSVFKDSMSINVSEHETLLRMKDEIVDKCDGLPLAAKTLAEFIPIQIFEERYWTDPKITKAVRLRLDLGDYMSYGKIRDKIVTTLGFGIEGPIGPRGDEVILYGKCHPIEIVRGLREFWPLELVSVRQRN